MVGFFIKYTFVRTVEILVVASLCPLQTSSHYLPVVTQAAVAPGESMAGPLWVI